MFSVDLYFSFRSPYSYFILPRIIDLKDNYDVNINFKLVYPLAIREPHFFQSKNAFTYFIPKIFDYFLQAKKLGMKFKPPKPDPIKQSILTGKISNHQPLIFDLCHLGQSMCKKNLGIEFAYEISNSIFGGRQSKAVLGDLLAVLLNNSMYTYKVAGPQVGIEQEIIRKSCQLIGYEWSSWSSINCLYG